MATIQLTGDLGPLPRLRAALDQADGRPVRMTSDEMDDLRAWAITAIMDHLDGDGTLPPLPEPQLLLDMMSVSAGEAVGPQYLDLMIDDANFADTDPRAPKFTVPAQRDDFLVVIVGAGMAGLCAAIRLAQAGIRYTIIERNEAVGGVWIENKYPGCGVDTPNHLYSYSFAPNALWTRHFSKRDEILAYFQQCAAERGIPEHVQFGTDVTEAEYDADRQRWIVHTRDRSGTVASIEANAIIGAVGLISTPKTPAITGQDRFAGPSFHSAAWPDDLVMTGKRIAIIGTGASAIQIGPTIAADAAAVTVFQRSAPWIYPDARYHRDVEAASQWLFANMPFYQSWFRLRLLWTFGNRVHPIILADPGWTDPDRSMNAANERLRQELLQHIHAELEGRDDLIEAMTPTFPPYGKRMLVDNHWFKMLRQDHVRLVTQNICEIDETGITTEDGAHTEVDVIVYATGFDAVDILGSLPLRGRSGRMLREVWDGNPKAHLGITVPDFPNLFCLSGPNTNLAHGGSSIFQIECQVTYVLACLQGMMEQGWSSLEVKQEPHDVYNDQVDEDNQQMPWSHHSVNSWFRGDDGRVVTNSPWLLVDYWAMTRQVQFDDYVTTSWRAASSHAMA